MPTAEYVAVALANAHEKGLTAIEVRKLEYVQIAELSGVVLGPNGESPADFYYTQVRQGVADALQAEEDAALHAEQKAALEASRLIFPCLKNMTVYEAADGFEVQ